MLEVKLPASITPSKLSVLNQNLILHFKDFGSIFISPIKYYSF